ncbi:MAG: bifunctional transcriptional activator/DNA repair enzyme AdaA [Opitutales bacterium]
MSSDLSRIAQAIDWLSKEYESPPSLEALAGRFGLSPSHFQRLFVKYAGVSPKQFTQQLSLSDAKERLRAGESVLDTALDTGLSGPGRLHDLFVSIEAVTPGEYKSGGKGVVLHWGIHPTVFGDVFLAVSERGLSALFFVEPNESSRSAALADLASRWPAAELIEAPSKTEDFAQQIFHSEPDPTRPLNAWVRGTNFQLQVWRALLSIAPGQLSSYGALAEKIGKPKAARAVGTAVGANPISLIIPCHRILRENGAIGGYHWGLDRKRSILAWEHAGYTLPH